MCAFKTDEASMSPAEVAWAAAALRLVDRYVEEVVLAFDLCPWAEPALRGGRVRRAACLRVDPTPADVLPFVDEIAGAALEPAAEVDIGLLVFPRAALGWAAFTAFAERVARADRARRPPGAAAPFLIAAFHPGGAEDFVDAHQMVSFVRRSPDPMLQLVRASLIERLKTAHPDLSDEIARQNHRAMGPETRARFEAAIRAIHADRDATYGALAAAASGSG